MYNEKDKQFVIQLLQNAIDILKEGNNGPGITNNNTDVHNSNIRETVVAIAKKYIGGKYKYGGKDMSKIWTDGVDCSGFTQGVYKEAGVKGIPNYACGSTQQREWGKETTNPRPGDLICYTGHVALYIGNNEVVNCGSTPIDIKRYDYRPIVAMKNVIGD